MKSKARIAGHSIHPMLVGFPIALFTATLGLELAHIGTQDAFYYRAAMIANVGGVVMALLAVIPGAIDLFGLPKESAARATGEKHAVLNLLTTALFAVSGGMLYRGWSGYTVDGAYLDAHLPLAFGVVGFVAMATAALLGYAMVQHHQVGVQAGAARKPRLVEDFHDFRTSHNAGAH
ncbi:MAG: hypothetical protein JWP01_3219 [Myxococcales bacterium]|nr:hypothetical protein [Myxococcales bacterium]